jgi:predicted 3-demethylubiquinone-9 3-methyltransferase (glyoxalase superfamily)
MPNQGRIAAFLLFQGQAREALALYTLLSFVSGRQTA